MAFRPLRISNWINRYLPPGTSVRKVVEMLSIILMVEGLSVLILFSYVGLPVGLISLLIGTFVLLLLRGEKESAASEIDAPGVRFVDYLFNLIGGEYVMMFLGAFVIIMVFVYNRLVSQNPDFGDSDSLAILLGFMMMLYSVVHNRFRIEASFALIFVGVVVMVLVLPRVAVSFSGGGDETSPAGDWYVHYMLAAPFAETLDLAGIPASSLGNLVTIQFQDGSIHTLSISAYCAGLYSLSIFLSAFIAFVLVFENLPKRVLATVLALGLLVAYLGNLFRMVVIGMVGYYSGIDALHWTHKNVGWMIFLSWSTIFWYMLFRYSEKRKIFESDALDSEK